MAIPANSLQDAENTHKMAVNDPLFRRKFPLLVGGGLLALHVISAPEVLAAEQFDCQPDFASGSWACSTQPTTSAVERPVPVEPVAVTPAEAPTDATVKPKNAKAAATAAVAAAQQTVKPADYAYLDWVPRDQLTEDQLAEIGPYCSGGYVEPYRPGVDLNDTGSAEPTYISAEASRYDQQTETAYLAGDVVLRQGSMQAEANEASFDQKDNIGELSGNVRLRDKGTLLVGDRAELMLDTGEAKIEDAEYVIHQQRIRGSARYAKREEDAIVRLKDGTYTSCAPGSNTWQLRGNNITLDPNTGFGSATNVVLKVKDIPVFYTPYIYFPIDDRRQSGFLPPSISTSSKNGTSLVTPYYFNLAPNFDATLYPNYMSKRGLLTEGEFRYLTRNSEGQVGGAWLKDHGKDRKWINTVPGVDLSKAPDSKDTRWMYSWQNTTGFDSRWMATVNYTDISDPYYFQDLDTNLDIDTPDFLHQDAGLSYRGDNYVARLNLQAYERATIIDVTPYERLPQLTLDGHVPGEWNGLNFAYSTEYVNFQRSLRNNDSGYYDSRVRGLNRAEGERIYVEPTVSLPMDWSWGYLTPKVKYSYTRYDLTLDGRGKQELPGQFKHSPDRSLPIASIDGGLYFDRTTQWFGNNYRQTLEPRLMYLYAPYEDQKDIPVFDTSETSFSYESLWRDNRFTGRDRIGDANQLSVGLTQRWIEPNGFERQALSIGQAFYFKDRKVQLPGIVDRKESKEKSSPYALAYQYRYNQDWRFSSTFNWDQHTRSTRSGSAMFHYQPADNPNKIVNLGYRYRDDLVRYDPVTGKWQVGGGDWGEPGTANFIKDYYKISQHDFSFIWPVVSQWSAIGSWQYDYNRNRTLDAFGGFEYNSCCWKLRLISRYWIDYDEVSYNPALNDKGDRGIFLQVVLKGLGGVFGNKTESFLDQGIQGYREREDQAF